MTAGLSQVVKRVLILAVEPGVFDSEKQEVMDNCLLAAVAAQSVHVTTAALFAALKHCLSEELKREVGVFIRCAVGPWTVSYTHLTLPTIYSV